MAMEVADELNVTPMEALLIAVQRAAGRVSWVDEQLAGAVATGDGVRQWLKASRDERRLLAYTAKTAIDAGVMETLQRQLDLEGQLLGAALVAGLDALQLDPDQRVVAMAAAHTKLLAIEAGQPTPGVGDDGPPSGGSVAP